jgi:uncharacterized membrane protein
MVVLLVLVVSFAVLRSAGALWISMLDGWQPSLRAALAVMFFVTASAHWGKARADLIRMVPPVFPRPEALVTLTGVLEILGTIGLVLPATTRASSICLAVMLVLMFPANMHAARQGLTLRGRKATSLPQRAALQVVFIAALIAAAWRT